MQRLPVWLRRRIDFEKMRETQQLIASLGLNTVCNHALCPNISECYQNKTASFLILGHVCSRNCAYCNITSGKPVKPDPTEPRRVAEAVARLGLRCAVITSVTRDDLEDGGASQFCETVAALRAHDASVKIELLVPDFRGSHAALSSVIASSPDMFAHNIETVPSHYHFRSGASYARSLEVLRYARAEGGLRVKSGLMLGLGESDAEIRSCLRDIRDAGAEYLSIGQYLRPSKANVPVAEYYEERRFSEYAEYARGLGYVHVESGPYVRSSYRANEYY